VPPTLHPTERIGHVHSSRRNATPCLKLRAAWLQTVLALATVNAVGWIVTAVYFLIWHERVEHFRRVSNCQK
jgi:hypothetical protein